MNDYQRRCREESKKAYAALMKFYPLTTDNLPGEIWLPVPKYEGYHVSNFGRVKSFKNNEPRILKPMLRNYLQICLSKSNKQKIFRVHRLVAQLFIPNPENKPEINHIDGCKFNNHVSNLEWATRSENAQHAYDTGLSPSGEGNGRAKLTAQQVHYVRDNPLGLTIYELADQFNVDATLISAIQLGKMWKKAGGAIRDKIDTRLPDDVREQIRTEYKSGVYGGGSHVLARKYGVHPSTIIKIIHENNVEK